MGRYILRRVLMMIPILLGVIGIVFSINYISPNDPAISLLGTSATPENIEAVHEELGLNRPFIVQLVDYIVGIFTRLDFGTSYQTSRPVFDMILERFPTTFKLGVLSIILSVAVGVPLGVLSATHQYSALDYSSTIFALIGTSIPSFWLALMMMLLFAVELGWLPPSGLDSWKHWIMPVVAVGIFPIANIMRTTRSSMLEVVRQDYIRTARSKGLSQREVTIGHALRNALIPVITVVGIQLGLVLSGTMVLEMIFSISGLGALLKNAISRGDYPVIQGEVLFCALIVCVVNLLVDIVYAFVDPRLKSQFARRERKTKRISEKEVQA